MSPATGSNAPQLTDPASIAALIDHTLLKPEAASVQIGRLCDEARQYGFASVCVNPTCIKLAAERLAGASAKVCTVVGFPLGAHVSDIKAEEARRAITDGAAEIDMVINIGALKDGDDALVRTDVQRVVEVCRAAGAICKVILECVLLTDDEKRRACTIVREAGADFVKTSTGFAAGGATVDDVRLMRETVGDQMGVKAAGGIRSLDDLRKMVAAGATRIGASAGVQIVEEARGGKKAAPSAGY